MSAKDKEELDPEMLANIDLMLNLDAIEAESDWNTVADLEAAEAASKEDTEPTNTEPADE
jgi:hypothetical protein